MNFESLLLPLICFLSAVGLWIVLFKSPLVPHLLYNRKRIDDLSDEAVESAIMYVSPTLYSLWLCPWCQAWWTAVLAWAGLFLFSLQEASFSMAWIIKGPGNPLLALAFYPLTTWTILTINSKASDL